MIFLRLVMTLRRVYRYLIGYHPHQTWLRLWLPLAMLGAIGFRAETIFIFAFISFLAFLGYLTVVSVVMIIKDRRTALYSVAPLVLLIALVNIIEPAGPYEEVYPFQRIIERDQTVKSLIHTFPGHPKWDTFDRSKIKPYIFIGIANPLLEGELSVSIAGRHYGDLLKIPNLLKTSGRYAFTIPWSFVDEHADLEVLLDFKPRQRIFFERVASFPIGGRTAQQFIRMGNEDNAWEIFPLDGKPYNLIIELRLSNEVQFNVGILQ